MESMKSNATIIQSQIPGRFFLTLSTRKLVYSSLLNSVESYIINGAMLGQVNSYEALKPRPNRMIRSLLTQFRKYLFDFSYHRPQLLISSFFTISHPLSLSARISWTLSISNRCCVLHQSILFSCSSRSLSFCPIFRPLDTP